MLEERKATHNSGRGATEQMSGRRPTQPPHENSKMSKRASDHSTAVFKIKEHDEPGHYKSRSTSYFDKKMSTNRSRTKCSEPLGSDYRQRERN